MRGNESISSVEGTLSRGKRDRYLESAQTLSEWRNLHAYFEQEVELAVQGNGVAQKRLSEAEAEMDKRNWEQRDADIALQSLRDWSFIRRINGQIRLKNDQKF